MLPKVRVVTDKKLFQFVGNFLDRHELKFPVFKAGGARVGSFLLVQKPEST